MKSKLFYHAASGNTSPCSSFAEEIKRLHFGRAKPMMTGK
jgi:hypothetical protein